jgi:hypothetical protein
MRVAALLLSAAFFAAPALAAPVVIAPASFSPEFQEKLDDELGVREAGVIQRMVDSALTRALSREGADAAESGGMTIETVVEDARASRPTFQQLIDTPGLSYADSIALGGARITGVLRGANGAEVARVEHRWYESTLETSAIDQWGDARRSINIYSRKVARAYRDAAN